MKKIFFSALACVCVIFHCPGQNFPPVRVKVLKDNTNLRAKPALNVEVAGQASANQELTVKSMDAEWIEVVAPTNIDFWVLGDYLKDGVVVCRQTVNVRAGPGINFSVVGQLTNNVQVATRGSHADWIKIAPPENCSLWVSRSLVALMPQTPVSPVKAEPIKSLPVEPAARPSELAPAEPSPSQNAMAENGPAKPGPANQTDKIVQTDIKKTEVKDTPKPAAKTNMLTVSKRDQTQLGEEKKTAAIRPPAGLDLIPDVAQGEWKEFAGVLKTKNFLARSPSDFRLVAYEDGRSHTVCFVKGNRAQLDALLFRELIISGRQYRVRRHRYPVLVPEKIILK